MNRNDKRRSSTRSDSFDSDRRSRANYYDEEYNDTRYREDRRSKPYDYFNEFDGISGSTSREQADIVRELFEGREKQNQNTRKSNSSTYEKPYERPYERQHERKPERPYERQHEKKQERQQERYTPHRKKAESKNGSKYSVRRRTTSQKKTDSQDDKTEVYGSSNRVKRRVPKKLTRSEKLKNSVGRLSKNVFLSDAVDESLKEEAVNNETKSKGIAKNIKTSRNNKKLLDQLQGNKKPLTKIQRRLKNILFSTGVVAVVLVIGLTLSLTVLFKCQSIEVKGTTRYTENEIISASGLNYGENIFMADRTTAQRNIEKKYPYIERADISFSVPDKLKINVTEATPKYYVQSGNKYYIISKESKLLELVDSKVLDIPSIKGCNLINQKVGEIAKVENHKVITVLNEVATSMEKSGFVGVKEINLSDMSEIELNYENRITILIGMPEYIDYKLKTAMAIINTKLAETDKGRLDCSNLIEGRTDDKDNASYFQPNHLAGEKSTQPPTQAITEDTTQYQAMTNYATEPEPQTETQPEVESNLYSPTDADNDIMSAYSSENADSVVTEDNDSSEAVPQVSVNVS